MLTLIIPCTPVSSTENDFTYVCIQYLIVFLTFYSLFLSTNFFVIFLGATIPSWIANMYQIFTFDTWQPKRLPLLGGGGVLYKFSVWNNFGGLVFQQKHICEWIVSIITVFLCWNPLTFFTQCLLPNSLKTSQMATSANNWLR